MPETLPFRSEPRLANRKMLLEASANRPPGVDPYRLPLEEMDELRLTLQRTPWKATAPLSSAPLEWKTAARWATHPDERVRVDVLTSGLLEHPSLREVREALVRAALAEAREEGVLWTPLLDAVAQGGWWPRGSSSPPLGARSFPGRPPTLELWLAPLSRWIEEEAGGGRLALLAQFQAAEVRERLFQGLRCPNPAVLEGLRLVAADWQRLARNPRLQQEGVDWLRGRISASLREPRRGMEEWPLAVRALLAVRERGGEAGADVMGLLEWTLARVRSWSSEEARCAAELLLGSSHTSPEGLCLVIHVAAQVRPARESLRILGEAIRHPGAGWPVWKGALEGQTSPGGVRQLLAEHAPARECAEVREALLRSRKPEVGAALCLAASSSAFAELLLWMQERLPAAIPLALAKASLEQLAGLQQIHWLQLLGAPQSECRLAAIRARAQLGEGQPLERAL